MLTDAQVERWSRQIVLPEVGARGQERLLAARVAVHGDGAAAATATTLLAGAGLTLGGGPGADVAVVFAADRIGSTPAVVGLLGARVVVATLLRGSCLACFADAIPGDAAPPRGTHAAAMALGALAANEALRVLLTAPTRSRLTILDVDRGTAVVKEIEPVGCRLCKAPA